MGGKPSIERARERVRSRKTIEGEEEEADDGYGWERVGWLTFAVIAAAVAAGILFVCCVVI